MSNFQARLLLAHGAGQDSTSPFMQILPTLLKPLAIDVVLFDFDYMIKARELGKKRPPEKLPKLQQQFRHQIEQQLAQQDVPLFIGGKSMGGRVASTIVAEYEAVVGAVCLGYPFHPPGKPENLRVEHLQSMSKPVLILQGTRDTFGKPDEIAGYSLADLVAVEFINDGDHSFTPRKASGLAWEQNMADAAALVANFITRYGSK